MTTDLTGRRIAVTGASSGIGRAIAAACIEAGAQVACIARDAERLERVSSELGVDAIVGDVSDATAGPAAVQGAAQAMGGIDGLVNNAGAMLHSRITEARADDWRVMLDSNILSVLLMSSAVVPHLRKAGGGDIVNISSTSALRVSAPEYAVYCATKAAVNMITVGLRQELAEEGIRVSALMPGLVANTGFGPGIRDDSLREQVMATKDERGMHADVVASQVVNMLSLPKEARLNDVVIVPAWQTA